MIETTTTAFTTEHTASPENCFEGSAPCRCARKSLSRSVAASVHLWLQRFAFLCALCVLSGGMALLAACESTRTSPDDDLPEEKPDQEIITGELQSDFLELGPQAGVQWLSFYPDDYLEYPELFEGYDRDQRRHLRLAPREGANKVLLKFDLPAGAKIKPVDWYGTECVAIDLPDAKGFTVALTDTSRVKLKPQLEQAWAVELATSLMLESIRHRGYLPANSEKDSEKSSGTRGVAGKVVRRADNKELSLHDAGIAEPVERDIAAFGVTRVSGKSSQIVVVVEVRNMDAKGKDIGLTKAHVSGLERILTSVSIVRELALEGSPKHQCKSSIEDLKAGIVAYEKGGLKLALPEGWSLRKTGGSSTVEIDGSGAKPLALIRRLKPHSNGDLRARVRADSVFARRCDRPDAFFGAGKSLTGAEPYVVSFDYRDNSVDQAALCVIATGNELLTIEVVATGLRDPQARRQARDALFAMLAQAEPSTQVRNAVQGLDKLVGWKPKE